MGRWKQVLGEVETEARGRGNREERERNGVRWGRRRSILIGGRWRIFREGQKKIHPL